MMISTVQRALPLAHDDGLYFIANPGTGVKLYRYDGANVTVADEFAGRRYFSAHGDLYFTGTTPGGVEQIYRRTNSGTQVIADDTWAREFSAVVRELTRAKLHSSSHSIHSASTTAAL